MIAKVFLLAALASCDAFKVANAASKPALKQPALPQSASTALELRGGGLTEVPYYAMIFYTFNTLAFATGMMDSMMVSMMGTTPEALPIAQGPIVKAMFFGFTVCNAVIAALLSSGEKFTQLVAACFFFGFALPMTMMFKSGILGVPGALQYGVMNGIFGSIAAYNYMNA